MHELWLPVLALVLSIGAGGCSSSSDDAIDTQLAVEHGGLTRFVDVHVPEGTGGEEPVDLLIAFHGAGGSGPAFRSTSGFDAEADRGGFVVAYPSATGANWAEGCGCVGPDLDGIDDVGFAGAVPEAIESELNLRIGDVYAAGYSQGGVFVHHLACEQTDRYAGFAVVAGLMSVPVHSSCMPAGPVSFLSINGSADPVIPFGGIPSGAQALLGAVETMTFWKDNAGCASADRAAGGGVLDIRTWESCEAGTTVQLIEIRDGGHAWPRSPVDAPSAIADFLGLR